MLFFMYILGVALITSNKPYGQLFDVSLPGGIDSIAKFDFTPPV